MTSAEVNQYTVYSMKNTNLGKEATDKNNKTHVFYDNDGAKVYTAELLNLQREKHFLEWKRVFLQIILHHNYCVVLHNIELRKNQRIESTIPFDYHDKF